MNVLKESMQIERANDVPTDSLSSIVSKIRRRLFQGDSLSAARIVSEFQCSNGLLSITVRELKELGYVFTEGTEEGPNEKLVTTYTMVNPEFWPPEAEFQRVTSVRTSRQRKGQQKRRAAQKKYGETVGESGAFPDLPEKRSPKKRRGKPPLPVLPQIGQELRVTMLSVDEDTGEARIGLKNGSVSWQVVVEAQVGA